MSEHLVKHMSKHSYAIGVMMFELMALGREGGDKKGSYWASLTTEQA